MAALKLVTALVLDDNAHMRALLREILAGFGFRQSFEAADVKSALAIAAGGGIDVVLADFKLASEDGTAFCRAVRRHTDTAVAYLPIIMVTAYSERLRVIEAINAGVDEFLVKPVRPMDIASRLNAVIERRRQFVRAPDYFGPDRRRRNDPRFTGPHRRFGDGGVVDI